jgi:hypothetical protein
MMIDMILKLPQFREGPVAIVLQGLPQLVVKRG